MTAVQVGTERASTPAPSDMDVLLVDDRQENLLALEAILDPLGLHLVRASSGEEALREVLRREFAVILLDVQMPGMNGFETAKVIKSRERSRHVPIIFLTAISKEEQYVFEGYSVGAVDYLSKPFSPDVLRSKVSVFVELHQKSRQLREQDQRLRLHDRATASRAAVGIGSAHGRSGGVGHRRHRDVRRVTARDPVQRGR